MEYKSDLQIAQEAKMKNINEIAKKLDLTFASCLFSSLNSISNLPIKYIHYLYHIY